MTRQTRHPEVVYTDLEDGAVLLHVETKLYYSLNEVGASIWRHLDAADDIDELGRRLMAEYDVEQERAASSATRFIRQLEQDQLVVVAVDARDSRAMNQHGASASATAKAPPFKKKRFTDPELLRHDEPLHGVVMNPFDPQLPLAE